MEYQLKIEERPGYVIATGWGDHTIANASRFLREAHEACMARGLDLLVLDFRLDGPSLGPAGIFAVTSGQAEAGKKMRKIAYVDASSREESRKRFAETVAFNRGVNVRLFGTLEEACKWIEAPG